MVVPIANLTLETSVVILYHPVVLTLEIPVVILHCIGRRQCGPVVRALALRSGDPGFKSQLVCLQPVGILNSCCCSVLSFRCVSLALKSPYGERSIKYVLYCIVLY